MKRKKLEDFFKKIDYSNEFENELKHGFIVLEKYMNRLGVNTIKEESEIKKLLGKFLLELQFPQWNIQENEKDFIDKGYEAAIILLQKIYPFKEDPPPFPRIYNLSFLHPKYSYKTESKIIDIIKTGREGGSHHILKLLVKLSADYMSELHVECSVEKYFKGCSLEQEFEVGDEYLEKYGMYLPKMDDEFELEWYVKTYIRKILIEHPKMIYKLGRDINTISSLEQMNKAK